MPQQPHLAKLYAHFPTILTSVPRGTTFDSHWLIERIAQAHQLEYIDALTHYLTRSDPFRQLHRALSRHLHYCATLIRYRAHKASSNIFGDVCKCAYWERL
jgi:hypothetical protein